MIRQKISSNLESMEELHLKHGWIPGSASIRPNPTTIDRKANYMANLLMRYATLQDVVLHRFFGLKTALQGNWTQSRMYVPESEIVAARFAASVNSPRHAFRLVPNLFPYQVPTGTHHSVIWFLMDGTSHVSPSDDEINASIEEGLRAQLQGSDQQHFSFVWYPNPKPTVVSTVLFHVQVFWISTLSVTNEVL